MFVRYLSYNFQQISIRLIILLKMLQLTKNESEKIMPKKRILPYIIMGILKQNPNSTGKFITTQFTDEIGEFWKASHSQIYPELKKMLADNWIKTIPRENNSKEIHYSLTETGKQKLDEWIRQPLTELPISHDMFSLKLFFINDKSDPRIQELIAKEKALLSEQLAHLKSRKKLLFADSYDHNYGHYLILTRAISRIEGQLEWLNKI